MFYQVLDEKFDIINRMSESGEIQEIQPIHLLPDGLFKEDEQAMNQAPEPLKGISFWKLEWFIQLLPLAKKWGEIVKNSTLSHGGEGQDGRILHLKLGREDIAIKLMSSSRIDSEDHQKLVDIGILKPWPENWKPVEESERDLERRKKTIFGQAIGQRLGNSLEPEYVPPLLGVFTYKGQPIGYVMPFIDGEACNVADAGLQAFPFADDPYGVGRERYLEILIAEIDKQPIELTPSEIEARRMRRLYYDALDHLKEKGIYIDYSDPASNAIVTDNNKQRGIQLIDLSINEQ